MAAVRTDVLLSQSPVAEGDHVDVICPAGKRMVVTNIDCSTGESGFTPLLSFEDLVTGGTWFDAQTSGILQTSVQWQGRQAFNYAGGFRANAQRNDWDVRVTGYLLDLP
jgi:hypothetical protein